MSGRFVPYLRFGRNVLIVDLAMGLVVLVVTISRGWTSLEESTLAILAGGVAILALALLPGLASSGSTAFGMNGTVNSGTYTYFATMQPDTTPRDNFGQGITWTLLAAGFIPLAYAVLVATLLL